MISQAAPKLWQIFVLPWHSQWPVGVTTSCTWRFWQLRGGQWDFQGPPRTWDPLMVSRTHTSFPYHSHVRIRKDMGMVCPWNHPRCWECLNLGLGYEIIALYIFVWIDVRHFYMSTIEIDPICRYKSDVCYSAFSHSHDGHPTKKKNALLIPEGP